MRRFLLLVVLLVSSALPASALASGGNYGFDGGTPAQRAQVRAALEVSAFDWNVVPQRITIHLRRDVPSHATRGHIWLDGKLVSSGRFAWATIQDEYAHQVDFFRFDDATRAHLTGELGARDWCYDVHGLSHHEYGCERFSSTLVWAFWPSKDNAYRPTSRDDESAAMEPKRFRSLVSGLLGMHNPFAFSS
jgi:hypothetical protein